MRGGRHAQHWQRFVAACLLFSLTLLPGHTGSAATTEKMRDVLSRQSVGLPADHAVTFVTPTGVDDPSDTIILGFPYFSFGTFAVNDVDFAVDDDNGCDGPWTQKTLAASPDVGVWGVTQSGTDLTLAAPTDATTGEVALNTCVQIVIGSNASEGGSGATLITNPPFAGTRRIDISGTFGDSGYFWVVILTSDSVSVTATVASPIPPPPPDTVVHFLGIASPNSQVTVERQGTILVSVPADPTGHFDITLHNQPTGIWTYSLYAEDTQGRVSRASNFTMSLTSGSTTTISGIFLGPTIEADQTVIAPSETVTFLGATAPSSTVSVYVAGQETTTYQTPSDSGGAWVKQFLGSDLGLGDFFVRAKAVTPSSEISAFSNTLPLTVAQGTPDQCAGKSIADINCDGRVNLTDFSIMLYYWNQANPANSRTDMNGDSRVNITDFSILLYYWTG